MAILKKLLDSRFDKFFLSERISAIFTLCWGYVEGQLGSVGHPLGSPMGVCLRSIGDMCGDYWEYVWGHGGSIEDLWVSSTQSVEICITEILREINFVASRSAKIAVFAIL